MPRGRDTPTDQNLALGVRTLPATRDSQTPGPVDANGR